MVKHAALIGLAIATPVLCSASLVDRPDVDMKVIKPDIMAPATGAWGEFMQAHPGTDRYDEYGRIARIYGPAFSQGATAKASADAFVEAHSDLWGMDPGQMLPIGPFSSGEHIIPLMTNSVTGEAKFQLVAYTPHIDGVPVYDAAMRLLVRNEPGFPLVLASVQIPDVTGFQPVNNLNPANLDEATFTKGARGWFEPGAELSGIRPVIFAGVNGES